MSKINEPTERIEKRGGPRRGSGPKAGSGVHVKICVSVQRANWQAAKAVWEDKASHLVDMLLANYVKRNEVLQ